MRQAATAFRLLRGAARRGRAVPASELATVAASDRYRLLSVDVFETLLRRAEPGDRAIRAVVASAAARLAARRTGRAPVPDSEAAARRSEIERRLRAELRLRGRDPEVSHREVLRALLDELAGQWCTRDDLDRLCEYEVALEARYTSSDDALARSLDSLRSSGRRVIAVSDMYLAGTELDALLQRHGVEVDRVYTSCDVSLSKFSGRLYAHVASAEGVAPHEILHVGDNLLGDVWSARAAGVSTVHWRSVRPPVRRAPNGRSDDAYRLGYDTLGPPLVAAARLLLRRAEVAGIDDIAFVARDGDLFQQVTERVIEAALPLYTPRLSYVHLSRRSTGASALTRLRAADVGDVLAAKATNRGLRTVFDAFNLDARQFATYAEDAEITELDAPVSMNDPRLAQLLGNESFQADFAREACRQRTMLRSYLARMGFFDEGRRVVLADVGWRGTIQSSLGRTFGDEPCYAVKRGYYIGLWDDGVIEPPRELDDKEGLLCDFRRKRTVREGAAWYLAFAIEALSRADHGTVLGYRPASDGRVVPVLAGPSASRSGELAAEHVRTPIREGILARAEEEAGRLEGLVVDESSLRRQAQRTLMRLAFFPTRREVDLLASMVHTESFAEDWAARLVADPSTHSLLRPRSWLAGLQSPWRAGFVRATGGYPLAALFLAVESALLAAPRAWRRELRRRLLEHA